jgi:hypothetical protein
MERTYSQMEMNNSAIGTINLNCTMRADESHCSHELFESASRQGRHGHVETSDCRMCKSYHVSCQVRSHSDSSIRTGSIR